MSDWRVWLTCMIHGCSCRRTHSTSAVANRAARIYTDDLVSRHGYTACECHDGSDAAALGIAPFRCDAGLAFARLRYRDVHTNGYTVGPWPPPPPRD